MLKRFEKEINNNDDENIKLEKLQKMSHTLSLIAKTKTDLANKDTRIEGMFKLLEKILSSKNRLE
jgi:hypothetical protein